MKKPYQTLNSQIVWSSPWYRVRQDEVVFPDGTLGQYNVVEKETAVWIIPVTHDKQVVLIHNYRYTVEDYCWEIPAGSVKAGQTNLEAAKEELLEEVGGTAQTIEHVCHFYTANGICNEVSQLYLATGVTLTTPHHEPSEVMTIHPMPIPEALAMARSGQMTDAPSALGLLLCESRLLQLHNRAYRN